jgi:hypothetical protein
LLLELLCLLDQLVGLLHQRLKLFSAQLGHAE